MDACLVRKSTGWQRWTARGALLLATALLAIAWLKAEVGWAQGAGIVTWAAPISAGGTALAVSDDGATVIFKPQGPGSGSIWRRDVGVQPLEELPGYRLYLAGAAPGGRVAVGGAMPEDAPTQTKPAVWRDGLGWSLLPHPPGSNAAYPQAASADGRVLAGIAGAVQGNVILWANPALWVDGQPEVLPLPPERPDCREGQFTAVSPAGDAAAGFVGPAGCNATAIVWTREGGVRVLGTLPWYERSVATAVSNGAALVVGNLMARRPDGYWATTAFRWTPFGGMEQLPDMGEGSTARAISADGRIIGGSINSGGRTRAAIWKDGVPINLQEAAAQELGPGDVLGEVTAVSPGGTYVAGVGSRGLQQFVFVARVPQPPSSPSLVGIWPIEGERERAMITWAPPPGATRYRLQSALDPAFTFGVNTLEFPSGPYNLLVVGAPTWDGGVFYYRIAACNDEGCSGWSPPLALGRRIWPGPEHWNLLAGGFRFLDRLYLWGVNASPILGKASEIRLYEGLQGFGGILRKACPGVAPGASCQADFASISALASVSQAFPPYGEVGIGFWTR